MYRRAQAKRPEVPIASLSRRELREHAGATVVKAAAEADVTPTTVRMFEVGGPDAVRDATKRSSLVSLYVRFAATLTELA